MVKRRRAFKKKAKTPKGYDSGLEYELHQGALKDWQHHTTKINYISRHKYEPDFIMNCAGKTIYLEVKGRFRDNAEAAKYNFVRESLLDGEEELIFIFEDSNKPMPFAKKRKDGTKYTHGEWAEKNNFRYYCNKKGLPEDII